MATNYIQPGENIYVATATGLDAGDPFVYGDYLPCVLLTDAETASPYNATVKTDGIFDLSDYVKSGTCYIAIPLNNGSDYDPFINLRITNPENKEAAIPYLGYYQGEVIYSNMAWKMKHGISTPPFRTGFDAGYNPPLKAGQNAIFIELEWDPDMPDAWEFSVVGGIEKLSFL